MKPRHILMAALLGLVSTAVFAANPAPAAATGGSMGHGPGMKFCESHAKDCADQAAKFDQWCSANAQKCTDLKAFVERHREWCEANKGECKEVREQARADRKEWCSKHPDRMRCKAMNTKDEDTENDTMPPS
ncbi:MAG: hypothetical protein ACM3ZT_03660 [Bacillota bacterium]